MSRLQFYCSGRGCCTRFTGGKWGQEQWGQSFCPSCFGLSAGKKTRFMQAGVLGKIIPISKSLLLQFSFFFFLDSHLKKKKQNTRLTTSSCCCRRPWASQWGRPSPWSYPPGRPSAPGRWRWRSWWCLWRRRCGSRGCCSSWFHLRCWSRPKNREKKKDLGLKHHPTWN